MDASRATYKQAPSRTPCGNTQSNAQHPAYMLLPLTPIPGEQEEPPKQALSHHRSWKVIARAGRAIPFPPLALLGILQAATSPRGASPAQPGRVPSCRGAQAEWEPGTGAPEELPCLPARRDGFAEREGETSANNKEQRMQRDKRRYLPGNHYKVL